MPTKQIFALLVIIMLHGLSVQLMVPRVMQTAAATPVADEVAVEGSCSDTPVSAFSPDLAYTVTFAPASRTSVPSCAATVALSGNVVNGDTAPTNIVCDLADEEGFVVLKNRTPNIKIGGLQCNTEDRSLLEVNGDGVDNAPLDVAFLPVNATDWDNAKKVDQATSSAKRMLFGPGGQVGAGAIVDGEDHDQIVNGEVVFGGTVASQGASKIFAKVDYTGIDVSPVTHQETLTFTFTPQ